MDVLELNQEIEIPAASPSNSLTVISQVEQNIALMRDSFLCLTIADVNDRPGYEKVRRARITVKKARVEVEKARKYLNEDHQAAIARNNTLAKSITAKLEPIETELKAREDWYEAEQARIEREELERKNQFIRSRVDRLNTFGVRFDGVCHRLGGFFIAHEDVAAFDEAEFEAEVQRLQAEYETINAERIERERLAEAERLENQRLADELRQQRAETRLNMKLEQEKPADPPAQFNIIPGNGSARLKHEADWLSDCLRVQTMQAQISAMLGYELATPPMATVKEHFDKEMRYWIDQLTLASNEQAKQLFFNSVTSIQSIQ